MLKTLMFCHVEDNNTIPGLENKITMQKYDLLIFKFWNFLWYKTIISPKTQ